MIATYKFTDEVDADVEGACGLLFCLILRLVAAVALRRACLAPVELL